MSDLEKEGFDDDQEDNEDNEGDGTEAKEYTEIELAAEREDLIGRGVYTKSSIEEFVDALRAGENYQEAAESYLKLTPDEPEDEDETVSESEEYPLMSKELADRAKDSGTDPYPKMTKELKEKKKKNVNPKNWTPASDYPTMEKEFSKKKSGGENE